MKYLYKFYWDVGRMGEVEGVFIEDDAVIKDVIGKEVYFGEILGKHSDIFGTLKESALTIMSSDPDFIAEMENVFGGSHISGYSPLDYIDI